MTSFATTLAQFIVFCYSLTAICCGAACFVLTARFFPSASSTDLLLLHAASLVWFTEGLYAAYPFVQIDSVAMRLRFWNTVSLAKLIAAAFLLFRAGELLNLARFIAAFEILYAVAVISASWGLRDDRRPARPPTFSRLLVFAQGSHAATAGPFGVAITLFPAVVAGAMTGVDVAEPSVAFDAALALGALESTMTVAYALSAIYSQSETSRHFSRCSVVSRLFAAVALIGAYLAGVGHAKALGGVGPGIVSALMTAVALHRSSRSSDDSKSL
jgi:hypothetical protein